MNILYELETDDVDVNHVNFKVLWQTDKIERGTFRIETDIPIVSAYSVDICNIIFIGGTSNSSSSWFKSSRYDTKKVEGSLRELNRTVL